MTRPDIRERATIDRAKDVLGSLGRWPAHVYIFKTSGNKEPDLVGVYNGRAIVCEGKQPGEKPHPAQRLRLRQWAAAGAFALWTDDGYFFHRVYPEKSEPETIYSADELRRERDSIADGRI